MYHVQQVTCPLVLLVLCILYFMYQPVSVCSCKVTVLDMPPVPANCYIVNGSIISFLSEGISPNQFYNTQVILHAMRTNTNHITIGKVIYQHWRNWNFTDSYIPMPPLLCSCHHSYACATTLLYPHHHCYTSCATTVVTVPPLL